MGKRTAILIFIFSILLIQSCTKSADPQALVAKDPLAVIYMKSMKSFKATLPPQAMMAVSMAEGAAVGLDTEKPIYFVLTTLNPVSAYLVLPMKDPAKKDELVKTLPANIQPGVRMNGSNAMIPLYGNLPTEFAAYDKMKSSELSIFADLQLINDKYGDYISKKMKEGGEALSSTVGADEQKLVTGIFGFYEVIVNDYLKNSKQLTVEYNKTDKMKIDSRWEFKEDSPMNKAIASLMDKTIPEAQKLSAMPMYYAMAFNWKETEPLFGKSLNALDPLYESIGIDFDFKEFMDAFKQVGNIDAVGGMGFSPDMKSVDMQYIFRTENNELMKTTLNDWFEKMIAKENKILEVRKSETKLNGEPLYEMSTQLEQDGGIQMSTFLGGDKSGYYYSSSPEKITELSKMDIKKGSTKGYFQMKIDYGKIIPQTPGVPQMNFILNAIGGAEKNTLTFSLVFE